MLCDVSDDGSNNETSDNISFDFWIEVCQENTSHTMLVNYVKCDGWVIILFTITRQFSAIS